MKELDTANQYFLDIKDDFFEDITNQANANNIESFYFTVIRKDNQVKKCQVSGFSDFVQHIVQIVHTVFKNALPDKFEGNVPEEAKMALLAEILHAVMQTSGVDLQAIQEKFSLAPDETAANYSAINQQLAEELLSQISKTEH